MVHAQRHVVLAYKQEVVVVTILHLLMVEHLVLVKANRANLVITEHVL